MARWKLVTPHYLNSPGVVWEYNEVDRKTGRQVRHTFPVPRYIDPRDPLDWTVRWGNRDNEDGEVIVCHLGRGAPEDITFIGDPTPDMIPVDDEAKSITAGFVNRWKMAPEQIPMTYSQSLIDQLQIDMAEITSHPTSTAKVEGLTELIAAIAALVKSNEALVELRRP